MAAGPRGDFVDDADLHGLVDGQLEGERRDVTLRHLSASPEDRAKVEAWQDQNDLLRSAFARVTQEALPALLDLNAQPRLHCIPANDVPLVEPPADEKDGSRRGGRIAAAVATIFVIVVGLGGSWLLDTSRRDELADDVNGSGAANTTLSASPAAEPEQLVSSQSAIDRLPTTKIPDLDASGFRFTGAETANDPDTIVFRYRRGKERMAVSVARPKIRPSVESTSALVQVAEGYGWRTRDKTFVVTGNLRLARLRDAAVNLRKITGSE